MLCMSQQPESSSSHRDAPQNTAVFASPIPQRTISQLLATASKSVITSPPSPIRRQPSPQRSPLTPEELAQIGIKVRDFGYESGLPPIRPYRPQTQPLPRTPPRRLKRNRHDGYRMLAPLERVVTEPVVDDATQQRHIGQTNANPTTTLLEPIEIDVDGVDHLNWYQPQSQPPLVDSQESDPHVDTPLVTPNGSLQWIRDTSSSPASQLDSESQNAAPEMLSFAELGFSQPDDDVLDVHPAPAAIVRDDSRASSPLSTISTPPLSSPSPPPTYPRYNLRKRPSPTPMHSEEPPTSRPRNNSRRPPNSGRTSSPQKAATSRPRPVRKAAQTPRSKSRPGRKRS